MDAILRALPSGTATLVSAQEVRNVIVLLVMPKGVQRSLIGGELASCGFDLSFTESPIEATSRSAFVLTTSHEDDSGILKTLPEGAYVIHKGPKFTEELLT